MAPTRFPQLRVAGRLANGFALDTIKAGGYGRDIVDGLIKMAIAQANWGEIARSPELQRRYATLEAPPPIDLRRPVSVNAVAASLRIPYETTRRRIRAMAAAGECRMTPRGVVTLQDPIDDIVRTETLAQYERVRTLYGRLRGIGLLEDLPASQPWDQGAPAVRLVLRLASDYVLRLTEPLAVSIGDPVTGFVLMDIHHANTENMPDTEGGTDDPNITGFPPDTMRRPARLASLAERLGISPETVRRHVNRLVELERCTRIGEGYVVPNSVLARGALTRFMLDNHAHLNRMFGHLAEMGVVASWERERRAVRGAA